MTLTEERAVEIARQDAETAYDDLSEFAVTATFDGTNWHVEYEPEADALGGGPEYVIAGESGEILEKHYRQ